jgi:uncharacterized protein
MDESVHEPSAAAPRWLPLEAVDRRVLGVLVEKAKTTPDAYPMSVIAVCTASNQKSNRFPLMELEVDDVQESLDRLRQLGAVGMVEGHGRVTKYRHYAYQWLGVEKVEAAVMTELLLRGTQTEGELRGRAARMEPIADLAALRPVLASLKAKRLVLSVTPEGRGHVVTHALYPPRELEKILAEHGRASWPIGADAGPAQPAAPARPALAAEDAAPGASDPAVELVDSIRREMAEIRAQVAQLRSDLDELAGAQRQAEDQLRRLRDDLGA